MGRKGGLKKDVFERRGEGKGGVKGGRRGARGKCEEHGHEAKTRVQGEE